MNINSEMLISAIKERPAVWDKSMESYKDKRRKFEAWTEICKLLNEDYESLTESKRNEFSKSVVKKWANMRDNWVKCHKKLKDQGADWTTKLSRKYIYYEEMSFLKKIVGHREFNIPTSEGDDDGDENTISPMHDNSTQQKRKMKELDDRRVEFNPKMAKFLDSAEKEEESRMLSFFKGILPTVEKFSEEEVVEFQFDVMKIIRDITQRTHAPFSLKLELQE
ncbi:uncharacterized protein LOC136038103 isoform X1 [Artemia franciscana]